MPSPPLSTQKRIERRRMFVDAYFAHGFNGSAAAISVGVPPRSASKMASTWLRQDVVVKMMNERYEALKLKHEMSLDAAIAEMAHVGRANIAHYLKRNPESNAVEVDADGQVSIDFTMTKFEEFAAVGEITVTERVLKVDRKDDEGSSETIETKVVSRRTTLKMHDKIAALDKLMRYFGAYNGKEAPTINDNRTQVLVQDGGTVNLTQEDAADEYRKMLG